jgi:hypothetical protein
MTQERLSKFVFSAILVAVTAYWLWFLFTHADQIFRARLLRAKLLRASSLWILSLPTCSRTELLWLMIGSQSQHRWPPDPEIIASELRATFGRPTSSQML